MITKNRTDINIIKRKEMKRNEKIPQSQGMGE